MRRPREVVPETGKTPDIDEWKYFVPSKSGAVTFGVNPATPIDEAFVLPNVRLAESLPACPNIRTRRCVTCRLVGVTPSLIR